MDDRSPMSLARLRALLDAYGANPDRWPPEERDAGRALLAQSPQAQRWRDASAQLDALLDLTPAATASPALVERILAAAPQRGNAAHARGRFFQRRQPLPVPLKEGGLEGDHTLFVQRQGSLVAKRGHYRRSRAWRYVGAALPLAAAAALVLWLWAKPSRTPERTGITVADLGTYDVPTDVLLAVPSVEALDTVPSFGCTGAGLGCLDPAPLNNQSALDGETYV